MRAAVLEEFGTPMVLKEIDEPAAGPGQVLVRIEASGVNPLDIKIAAGQAAHAERTLPAVLGLDLAGVVEQVGEGVGEFAPGDEVYGMTGGVGDLQGSLAQYAAVDARLLAPKPRSLDMRAAAALPLVTITAWEGLVDRAQVHAGQKVLMHGGAGGVGHVGLQIARARGAEVFGTEAPHRLKAVEEFGATAIDHTAETPQEYVARLTGGEGFDIVYDTVGGPVLDASFAVARAYTGHVLSSLGWGTHSLAPLSFRGATYSGVFTLAPMLTGRGREHHGEILREVTALVDSGRLRPLLDSRVFGLADVTDAHAAVADGTAAGKIVVSIAH
ncbi:zinc-dependent alcohol dehydrogenase family protein [Streptomyces sp. NPDC003393]